MLVRSAELADISRILSVVSEAAINPRNITARSAKNGFLVYPLDEKDYADRLFGNKFFLVITEGDVIKGFVMCYELSFLKRLIVDKKIQHEDGIIQFLETLNGAFLYGDQIGVSTDNRSRKAGTLLLQEIFRRMRRDNIEDMYVAILHKPIHNSASIRFVSRFGFSCKKEVVNSDGLVWGIYHLNINKI